MSEALKSCPFCGASGIVFRVKDGSPPYVASCSKCPASLSLDCTEEDAIDAWNTRTPSAEYRRGIEDAAKCADAEREKLDRYFAAKLGGEDGVERNTARYQTARTIADAIRSLIQEEKAVSMTVRRLITALKKMPPDAKIVVCAHDQSAEHGELDGFVNYVSPAPKAIRERGAGVVIQL